MVELIGVMVRVVDLFECIAALAKDSLVAAYTAAVFRLQSGQIAFEVIELP